MCRMGKRRVAWRKSFVEDFHKMLMSSTRVRSALLSKCVMLSFVLFVRSEREFTLLIVRKERKRGSSRAAVDRTHNTQKSAKFMRSEETPP